MMHHCPHCSTTRKVRSKAQNLQLLVTIYYYHLDLEMVLDKGVVRVMKNYGSVWVVHGNRLWFLILIKEIAIDNLAFMFVLIFIYAVIYLVQDIVFVCAVYVELEFNNLIIWLKCFLMNCSAFYSHNCGWSCICENSIFYVHKGNKWGCIEKSLLNLVTFYLCNFKYITNKWHVGCLKV